MKFSKQLQESANMFLEKEKKHSFILGLGSGNLDILKFEYYLKQDYVFLIGFCKAISVGISKASDLSDMIFLSDLLNETLTTEMDLHVQYCAEFGIKKTDLEKTEPSDTTTKYVDHMIDSSKSKGFLHSLVAILPCAWSYGEIATYLNEGDPNRSENKYIKWIDMYDSDEFKNLAKALMQIIDEKTKDLSELEKEDLKETFYKSTQYEYDFWDASWNMK